MAGFKKVRVGTQMHSETMAGGLFSSLLWKMAQKLPSEKRISKDKKQGRPAVKDDLTDAEVAECRRSYEAGEKKPRELAELFNVPRERMYAILNYRTRSPRVDVRTPA